MNKTTKSAAKKAVRNYSKAARRAAALKAWATSSKLKAIAKKAAAKNAPKSVKSLPKVAAKIVAKPTPKAVAKPAAPVAKAA